MHDWQLHHTVHGPAHGYRHEIGHEYEHEHMMLKLECWENLSTP
jgi:hypothetical protein